MMFAPVLEAGAARLNCYDLTMPCRTSCPGREEVVKYAKKQSQKSGIYCGGGAYHAVDSYGHPLFTVSVHTRA
jgi:hypothetical protein